MNGGGARVSIPPSVRRMIQNIKEIAGHHSDEDIYSMLKECAMDPNETAQKLLLQGLLFPPPSLFSFFCNSDTFHVVKRKRDKRKEVNWIYFVFVLNLDNLHLFHTPVD
ncbi:hypothetical protein BHE74_00026441 [Ensete ventricosum]|nr:hypothetical protein BHE74_00026441 [Ensete ventricosum]RZS03884.1 hypothetical protein BHM03_00034118 [Ensete ventricosum]